MKIIILVAFLAVASAFKFEVPGTGGKTCAILTLDGGLDLAAIQDEKTIGTVHLPFSKATLIENSTCSLIKLNMTSSAQVWFQFDADEGKKNWMVTPISTFVPEDVFGKDVNETVGVTLKASPTELFPMAQYYKCNSASKFNFIPETEPLDFNYTVVATVTGFQIQSAEGDEFSKTGKECAADAKPKQYLCKDGNETMIAMEGNFTLAITYANTKGENVTKTIQVPGPQNADTQGVCAAKQKTESLTIGFLDSWSIEFTFAQEDEDKYYAISNITVTYTFDDKHMPGHSANGSRTVDLPVSKDYLKASNDGYYICNAKLDKSGGGVTLSSKDFKYRAFDEKSKGFDGNVSECSADESSSSVVPIAVGAALAGLVVIVLVAYLIGRKRTRKTGYESV